MYILEYVLILQKQKVYLILSITYSRAYSIVTNKIYDFTTKFLGINFCGKSNRGKIIVNI